MAHLTAERLEDLRAPLQAGPRRVVLSAPTGSGKSTLVPRWFAGRVLVVEPRRVACQALAARVAALEDTPLGELVGYRVRDDARHTPHTRILFCTPGIALRMQDELPQFTTVVLDEFHERSLEVDLLLALCLRRHEGRLLVMSATAELTRLATHLDAQILTAAHRAHPLTIHHRPGHGVLPDEAGLAPRVVDAVRAALHHPGDVLVFLPGKGEIADAAAALASLRDLQVLALHGGLSLAQQQEVLAPGQRRRVILATNVAETSLTVPGVGVVVDSGLVRRTRYLHGRGHLALVPVAQDSADQRAGRAGRTGPGVVFRLWNPAARLEPFTPPEILRESLAPLVLGAAAWGEPLHELPLLDRPRADGLALATRELRELGALDASSSLTAAGRSLFDLPVDPWLGRLILEARQRGCLQDAVDLAAALSARQSVLTPAVFKDPEHPLLRQGCDACALIAAVRADHPEEHGLNRTAWQEARSVAGRLRRALGLRDGGGHGVDRHRLALTVMAVDRSAVLVRRRRGRDEVWAGEGMERQLATHSAVHQAVPPAAALLVLASMAFSHGHGDNRVVVTAAMPVPPSWLLEAGLGEDGLVHVTVKGGAVHAEVERTLHGLTLARRDEVPGGELARTALVELLVRGSLFNDAVRLSGERLERTQLWQELASTPPGRDLLALAPAPPPRTAPLLKDWLLARVTELGVDSGADLALLSAADFTAPDLPSAVTDVLTRHFPPVVQVGDVRFRARYEPRARRAVLSVEGRAPRTMPPASFFPRCAGFKVVVDLGGGQEKVIRLAE